MRICTGNILLSPSYIQQDSEDSNCDKELSIQDLNYISDLDS